METASENGNLAPNNVLPGKVAPRSLAAIAREIRKDWTKPYFGAVPYLSAMASLGDIGEAYGEDSAKSVVLYFLSNATTWKGETARRVKAELKTMLRAVGYKI